ncbi:hypothetical protein ADL00_29795 [Streptomyces sp. AS58]|uniref:hypothetical protein n=1 Tax=Streptomyces sp. AS58 TaxID=1519489 RepID=UPI0006ADB24A|nr:hypothetical protein [Streptomyces sp. AS58]KOV54578.1 hypothetical protein ADL00_29795 [Streptomyces sp. AS58]
MAINTTPPPAIAALVPDSEGHGTVLRIVYAHHLDGETLAFQLFHRYVHRLQAGTQLPDEITRAEVMALLGAQGADCAEGWHSSVNEPTEAASDEAWQWVRAQVTRLFPGLSWKVEPDRRMNIPGVDADKVADIVIRARSLASDVTRPATMFDPALTYYADGTLVMRARGQNAPGAPSAWRRAPPRTPTRPCAGTTAEPTSSPPMCCTASRARPRTAWLSQPQGPARGSAHRSWASSATSVAGRDETNGVPVAGT